MTLCKKTLVAGGMQLSCLERNAKREGAKMKGMIGAGLVFVCRPS